MNIMLRLMELDLAICKMKDLNEVALKGRFFSITSTGQEYSVVCESAKIPAGCLRAEKGYRAFQVMGQLDFSLIGIIAGITAALAKNKISVFVLSTFDTDYVLVKEGRVEMAIEALVGAGYNVVQ